MTKRYKTRTSITIRIAPELKQDLDKLVLDTGISQNEIVNITIQNVIKAFNEPKAKRNLLERLKK